MCFCGRVTSSVDSDLRDLLMMSCNKLIQVLGGGWSHVGLGVHRLGSGIRLEACAGVEDWCCMLTVMDTGHQTSCRILYSPRRSISSPGIIQESTVVVQFGCYQGIWYCLTSVHHNVLPDATDIGFANSCCSVVMGLL